MKLTEGRLGQIFLGWMANNNGPAYKKKNIYFAKSKSNYNTNIMSKHRGGFPERQTSIVLDTLSNAEYNITY